MTEIKEAVAPPPPPKVPCDHAWVETSAKSPADAKRDNAATAVKVQTTDPPSAKGYLFENHCIDTNMAKLKIEKASVVYECSKCGQTQEVDIVGESQLAECKNKKKADLEQAARIRDIQSKVKGGGKPLAKVNAGHDKARSLEKTYGKNGFETELVPGFAG